MKQVINEARVTDLWRRLAGSRADMVTTDGASLRVLYPGRPADAAGSDYRETALAIGGRRVTGDIEVHVGSRGWTAHHHDRDNAYNRVVLHVVLRDDAPAPACLENGVPIPVVALEPYLAQASEQTATCWTCSGARQLSRDRLVSVLEAAGEARFQSRVAAFGQDLIQADPAQCLYQDILGALGYPHNKQAFLTLASRLPLPDLVPSAPETNDPSIRHSALLLGVAGFLPSQRPDAPAETPDDPYVRQLENAWRTSQRTAGMSIRDWQLHCTRPGNHPVRRLAGMARLFDIYRGDFLSGFRLLLDRASPEDGCQLLEAGLMAPAGEYWATHFDFGREYRGLGPHLIGKCRAAEITVNVVLPFLAATCGDLSGKAQTLYAAHPPLEDNAIERHMRVQLGIEKRLVNTARRQQGLHHLYREYCTQGKCAECLLRETG